MDISSLSLGERVFHIDQECYIIYLGTDRDDYKPLLRIGNSPKLTRKIIENVYNIVVTDSLTGNPGLEPENMNRADTRENRYVGDRKSTGNYLGFIHQFKIENGTATSLEELKKTHDRAEVFFYKDGNIHVLYDEQLLFDLKRQEQKDLHFIERSHWLGELHSRNSLRYFPEDFEAPGFALLGKNIFLYEKGRITACGLPEDYFKSYILSGTDPDLIDTVITDEASGSLFELLKRKRQQKESIRILTEKLPLIRSGVGLFKDTSGGPVNADIVAFKRDETRIVARYRMTKTGRGITVEHTSLPVPLLISKNVTSREREHLVLNTESGTMVQPAKTDGGTAPIPEGVLHSFRETIPESRELVRIYFKNLLSFAEGTLNTDESRIVKFLDQLFDDFLQGRNIQRNYGILKKYLRKVKINGSGAIYYLFANAGSLTNQFAGVEDTDTTNRGVLSQLHSSIGRKLSSVRGKISHLPLICDIFPAKNGFHLFYRTVKESISKDANTLSADLLRDIEKREEENIKEYDQELNRLNLLIRELKRTLTPGEKRVLRKRRGGGVAAGVTPEGVSLPRVGAIAPGLKAEKGAVSEKERREAEEAEKKQAFITAPVQRVSYAGGLRSSLKYIIPAALVVIAAVLLFFFIIIPRIEGRRAIEERAEEVMAQAEAESEVEDGIGEGEAELQTETFEADEFLEKQDIPHSALTSRRTVLYRGIIEITILDVYLLTNEIATSNGYRRLDNVSQVGKDPDWIYPENLFVLPDKTEYSVVKGDTMWYIAHRFIIKRLEEDWERYNSIKKEIDGGGLNTERGKKLVAELEYIRERSYSENFDREIDKNIKKIVNIE
jgi:hypothetical protein